MCPGENAICAKGACSNIDGGIPAGDCMEGATECMGDLTVRFCQGAKWSVFFACDHKCVGGVCGECDPGEVRCNGMQKCTDAAIWEGTPCNN
jgi:hypothetical protein